MKRIAFVVLVLFMLSTVASYAFESKLLSVYNQIFDESKRIKALLPDTKDILLMNSLWDSCLVTITQIEAYFFMLSIFNTIKKEEMQEPSVDYLVDWLNKTKSANELSIKSLDAFTQPADPNTQLHMAALKVYYKKLNSDIDEEIKKLSVLKKSVQAK